MQDKYIRVQSYDISDIELTKLVRTSLHFARVQTINRLEYCRLSVSF